MSTSARLASQLALRLVDEAARTEWYRECAASDAAAARQTLETFDSAPCASCVPTRTALLRSIELAEAEAARACDLHAVCIDDALVALDIGKDGQEGREGRKGQGGKARKSRRARNAGWARLAPHVRPFNPECARFLLHAPALAAALGDSHGLDAVLHRAIRDDNPTLVRAVLADPAARVTVFHLGSAAKLGKVQALLVLLADARTLSALDAADAVGGDESRGMCVRTILEGATVRGRTRIVAALLASGLVPDAGLYESARLALQRGFGAVFRVLAADARFDCGRGLAIAAEEGHAQGVRLMLRDSRLGCTLIPLDIVESSICCARNAQGVSATLALLADARLSAGLPVQRMKLLMWACFLYPPQTAILEALLCHPRASPDFAITVHVFRNFLDFFRDKVLDDDYFFHKRWCKNESSWHVFEVLTNHALAAARKQGRVEVWHAELRQQSVTKADARACAACRDGASGAIARAQARAHAGAH